MPFPGLVCKNLPHVLLQALSLHPGWCRQWWRRDRGAWVPEWLCGVQPHPPCSSVSKKWTALCWTTTCLNFVLTVTPLHEFVQTVPGQPPYFHLNGILVLWSLPPLELCFFSRKPSFSSHLTGSSLPLHPFPSTSWIAFRNSRSFSLSHAEHPSQ